MKLANLKGALKPGAKIETDSKRTIVLHSGYRSADGPAWVANEGEGRSYWTIEMILDQAVSIDGESIDRSEPASSLPTEAVPPIVLTKPADAGWHIGATVECVSSDGFSTSQYRAGDRFVLTEPVIRDGRRWWMALDAISGRRAGWREDHWRKFRVVQKAPSPSGLGKKLLDHVAAGNPTPETPADPPYSVRPDAEEFTAISINGEPAEKAVAALPPDTMLKVKPYRIPPSHVENVRVTDARGKPLADMKEQIEQAIAKQAEAISKVRFPITLVLPKHVVCSECGKNPRMPRSESLSSVLCSVCLDKDDVRARVQSNLDAEYNERHQARVGPAGQRHPEWLQRDGVSLKGAAVIETVKFVACISCGVFVGSFWGCLCAMRFSDWLHDRKENQEDAEAKS